MEKELQKMREKLVELAVEIGKDFDYKLDYSVESIKHVDEILSLVHDDFMQTGNNEGLNGIALEMAMYISRVIEKKGFFIDMSRDHQEFGKDTFPVTLTNGKTIFPYVWCQKHIENGSQDSVWSKFNTLVYGK
ncbi:MAG: hypothetical protein R3B60_00975 [Candidatus Paceibacterota bacterium]